MAIAMLLTGSNVTAQSLKLKQHKYLPAYSSASAAAWHKGLLYLMGDDAPNMLVLNKRFREQRQHKVFPFTEQRIPYAVKPDLEAAVIIPEGRNRTLWFLPSFSTPARNRAVRVDVAFSGATPSVLTLAPFTTALTPTNIEGAAYIDGRLVLANRANSQAPVHYLLTYDLLKQVLPHTPDRQLTVQLPATPDVVGISGMEYLERTDILLLTVTTERMATPTTDGTIGPSYLAIVPRASQQLQAGTTIQASSMLPLAPVLQQKEPMKIESVTVLKQGKRRSTLVLAADNDNGTTHLFKISVRHLR